jgi:hypothetical protein
VRFCVGIATNKPLRQKEDEIAKAASQVHSRQRQSNGRMGA